MLEQEVFFEGFPQYVSMLDELDGFESYIQQWCSIDLSELREIRLQHRDKNFIFFGIDGSDGEYMESMINLSDILESKVWVEYVLSPEIEKLPDSQICRRRIDYILNHDDFLVMFLPPDRLFSFLTWSGYTKEEVEYLLHHFDSDVYDEDKGSRILFVTGIQPNMSLEDVRGLSLDHK